MLVMHNVKIVRSRGNLNILFFFRFSGLDDQKCAEPSKTDEVLNNISYMFWWKNARPKMWIIKLEGCQKRVFQTTLSDLPHINVLVRYFAGIFRFGVATVCS